MATKKTTTKAKTKSTKAKTTTKTAKATAKVAAKKPVIKQDVAKPEVKSVATKAPKVTSAADRLKNLRMISIASAAIFALLAGFAVFLMNNAAVSLGVGFLGKDELASTTTTVFASGYQSLFDVQLKWVVFGTMLASIIVPLLYVTRLRAWYEANLSRRVMPTRWLDLGITTALMVETIAVLSGMTDIASLKLVGGLMFVTCALGWIAERENMKSDKPAKATFYVSLLTGMLPWISIALFAISTYVYGLVRYPWYVYALYVAALAGFTLLAVNQWFQHTRRKQWSEYVFVERNYLLINLATKAAFAAILILGFQK